MKDISVIIPVYNEAANLPILTERLRNVMTEYGKSFECIFIDDGSEDDSYNVLLGLKRTNNFMRIIKLKKNFGQTPAIMAGFDNAEGNTVITIDADLQNDPGDIPMLIGKLEEGYDIVSGWRNKRKDNFLTRKVPSFLANKMISFFTGVKLHDYGCTLKAYRKDIVKKIKLYGEMHRFIPAVASYSGSSIAEVRVNHHAREHGTSKYGITRTLTVLLDLITVKFFLSYAGKPMQFFGSVGLFSIFVGAISFFGTILMKFAKNIDITGNPLFHLTLLMGIIGMQCILMGILGEMNVRIYHESLNKDTYTVEALVQ